MTIAIEANSVTYTGNGVTTVFPYSFKVLDEDHLTVYEQVIATSIITEISAANYTVTGVPGTGGSITYNPAGVPLPATKKLIIARDSVPYLQGLDIENEGGFHPESLEQELDVQVMQIQQLAAELLRAWKAPVGQSGGSLDMFGAVAGDAVVSDGAGSLVKGGNVTALVSGLAAEIAARISGDLVEQAARIAGDLALASLIGGNYSPLERPDYDSRVALSLATVSILRQAVRTGGYLTAGDGGAGLYKRVASEPSHAGKVQSLDGAWWELVVEGGCIRIEQFGGKADWNGTTGTDNRQPLLDILTMATFSSTGNAAYKVAPDICFGIGAYYFAATVELKKIVRIRGVGAGSDDRGNGTNFYFPADTTGFIVQQTNTEGASGAAVASTTTGQGSTFDGITIRQAGTDTTKHGIQMRARAIVRNCSFYDAPGNAIHIEAQAGSATIEGNANSWYVENCFAQDFGGHGLYVNGNDANAGTCIRFETKGTAGDYGCGVFEASGLGNNYFGLNIAGYGNRGVHRGGFRYLLIDATPGIGASTTPGTNNNIWYEFQAAGVAAQFPEWSALDTHTLALPIFSGGGGSNRSVFSGIYVEGSTPVHIKEPSVIFGGQMGSTRRTTHYQIFAGSITPTVNTGIGGRRSFLAGTTGATSNGTHIWAAVGTPVASDEDLMNVLEHRRQIDGDFSWEWKYEGGEITYGFLNAKKIWRISTPTTTDKFGRGLTPVAHMFSLTDFALKDPGNSNNWRIHGIRDAIPSAAGEYARGEVRWNSAPAAAGTVGWVCTTGGALASAWVTGTNYAVGNYIKATNTKFYKCTVDGGASSTVEPTHASGAVTEADGFEWTHVTDTEAVWKTFGTIAA